MSASLSAPRVAVGLDLLAGEPPAAVHPTVWMGRWLRAARAGRRSRARAASLLEGGLTLAAGAATAALAGAAAERAIAGAPPFARGPLRGAALKPALSLRALAAAGAEVGGALDAGDLAEARRLLGWHLVSRDTSELSEPEVAGAAIESLAENLSDALVAPLLAFSAGGLPAAYAYRLLNTADAMLGYRTPELEWYGKAAARADDAANWVPARASALLIAAAAPLAGADARRALACTLRDARRTPSPNAGWPMAAMAGALGVRLNKRGVYALNVDGRDPGPRDLSRAGTLVLLAGVLAASLCE